MDIEAVIRHELEQSRIDFSENISLATKTWIRRGGVAKFWVTPTSVSQLGIFVGFCYRNGVAFEIIGGSSNCYFLQDYNPFVVISTLRLTEVDFTPHLIVCEPGASLIKVARRCVEMGIPGYEGFIGLPGTVGGAAINNAGSYGSLMADVVHSVDILNDAGDTVTLSNSQMRYSDRSSALKRKEIKGGVLRVRLAVRGQDPAISESLKTRAERFAAERKKYQESRFRNLGSIFPSTLLRKGIRANWGVLLTVNVPCKIASLVVRDRLRRQSLHKRLFFLFNPSIGRNVSEFSFNCFVWKDESIGDQSFLEYIAFMRRRTKMLCPTEIELKGPTNRL